MSRTNKTKELLAQSLTELMVTTSLEKNFGKRYCGACRGWAQHLLLPF